MLFVRSAFWLAVAYAVLGSGPAALEDAASAATERMLAEGRGLVVAQIADAACETIECAAGKAALVAAIAAPAPAAAAPMPYAHPAPVPPPRPGWAG